MQRAILVCTTLKLPGLSFPLGSGTLLFRSSAYGWRAKRIAPGQVINRFVTFPDLGWTRKIILHTMGMGGRLHPHMFRKATQQEPARAAGPGRLDARRPRRDCTLHIAHIAQEPARKNIESLVSVVLEC